MPAGLGWLGFLVMSVVGMMLAGWAYGLTGKPVPAIALFELFAIPSMVVVVLILAAGGLRKSVCMMVGE